MPDARLPELGRAVVDEFVVSPSMSFPSEEAPVVFTWWSFFVNEEHAEGSKTPPTGERSDVIPGGSSCTVFRAENSSPAPADALLVLLFLATTSESVVVFR